MISRIYNRIDKETRPLYEKQKSKKGFKGCDCSDKIRLQGDYNKQELIDEFAKMISQSQHEVFYRPVLFFDCEKLKSPEKEVKPKIIRRRHG